VTSHRPFTDLSTVRGFLSRVLSAFGISAFPWLFGSTVLGTMNLVAGLLTIGWLVVELSDSAFWVGAAAAAQGLGQVSFGVFANVLIDRIDRRRIFVLAQLGTGAVLLALGLLFVSGQIVLWQVLAARFLLGVLFAIRNPSSDTIAYQIAGSGRMLNASAALVLGFNVARVIAPAAAGFLIAETDVSSGLYFAAGCGVAPAILALFIPGTYKPVAPHEPFWRAAKEGVKYVWANLPVRKLVTLSLTVETFGFSYLTILPVLARDVLGVGAAGYGLICSLSGVGAFLSTIIVAGLGDYPSKGRLLATAVASSGLSLVVFGLSRWYAVSLALSLILGAALSTYDVMMKTMILLVSSDHMRGRGQSIYTLTYGFNSMGGTDLRRGRNRSRRFICHRSQRHDHIDVSGPQRALYREVASPNRGNSCSGRLMPTRNAVTTLCAVPDR
jgi:MFS family permease